MIFDGIIFREGVADDLSFIYSSWLQSYFYGSNWPKSMAREIYFASHAEVIRLIMLRPGVCVTIASDKEDQSIIIGYMVSENDNVLHYSYVKKPFREMGIFNSLLKYTHLNYDISISHRTKDISSVLIKHQAPIYNPYLQMEL